jgi:cyclophilin family peptidyl-prolyl cis-trans isomerase
MIDESLATQIKKIIFATVTEFGNNANLSQFFITLQELHGIVQGFPKEMTCIQALLV